MDIDTFISKDPNTQAETLGWTYVTQIGEATKAALPKALQKQLGYKADGYYLRSAIVFYANGASGAVNETGIKKLIRLITTAEKVGEPITTDVRQQATNGAELPAIKAWLGI